jgi:hypothetical protein
MALLLGASRAVWSVRRLPGHHDPGQQAQAEVFAASNHPPSGSGSLDDSCQKYQSPLVSRPTSLLSIHWSQLFRFLAVSSFHYLLGTYTHLDRRCCSR